jgi:hypothetical protein
MILTLKLSVVDAKYQLKFLCEDGSLQQSDQIMIEDDGYLPRAVYSIYYQLSNEELIDLYYSMKDELLEYIEAKMSNLVRDLNNQICSVKENLKYKGSSVPIGVLSNILPENELNEFKRRIVPPNIDETEYLSVLSNVKNLL